MFGVSFVWYGAMMLLPASSRPWVGDTTDNSWFSLIFGANGLSRVSGTTGGPGGGFGGATGPLRLFNTVIGGQIAWLIPLALGGLGLGLWTRRRAARTDPARATYILWGGWAAVSWAIFSFQAGIFHPYYTTLLAPAVAVLAAGGLVVAWDRARESMLWSAILGLAMSGTAVLGAVLLGRASGFVTWLGPVAIGLAAAAGCALLAARRRSGTLGVRRGRAARGVRDRGRPDRRAGGADRLLVGDRRPVADREQPARGTGERRGRRLRRRLPAAGARAASAARVSAHPRGARACLPERLVPAGCQAVSAGRAAPRGASAAWVEDPGGAIGQLDRRELPQSPPGECRVPGRGGRVADGGRPVAEDRTQRRRHGRLHRQRPGADARQPRGADRQRGAPLRAARQRDDRPGGGGFGGRGGPGGGANAAATTARDAWVKSHGTLVKIPGQTSSTASSLYYFA